MLATTAIKPKARGSLSQYGVFWHVWPQHAIVDGERRQIGVELELMGSHTADPSHLDPDCPECCRVRFALIRIAEYLIRDVLTGMQEPLGCEIDPHSTCIISSPGLQNRPYVSVSILITNGGGVSDCKPVTDKFALIAVKESLSEFGIPER